MRGTTSSANSQRIQQDRVRRCLAAALAGCCFAAPSSPTRCTTHLLLTMHCGSSSSPTCVKYNVQAWEQLDTDCWPHGAQCGIQGFICPDRATCFGSACFQKWKLQARSADCDSATSHAKTPFPNSINLHCPSYLPGSCWGRAKLMTALMECMPACRCIRMLLALP